MTEATDQKIKQLIEILKPTIYPTSQIVYKQITIDEYIISIAEFFANELFDRRIDAAVALIPFAKLGVLLHHKKKGGDDKIELQIEKLNEKQSFLFGSCSYDDCFEISEWFVEGFPYCTKHKEKLEEIARKEVISNDRSRKRFKKSR
jgi:hypothetical protein